MVLFIANNLVFSMILSVLLCLFCCSKNVRNFLIWFFFLTVNFKFILTFFKNKKTLFATFHDLLNILGWKALLFIPSNTTQNGLSLLIIIIITIIMSTRNKFQSHYMCLYILLQILGGHLKYDNEFPFKLAWLFVPLSRKCVAHTHIHLSYVTILRLTARVDLDTNEYKKESEEFFA